MMGYSSRQLLTTIVVALPAIYFSIPNHKSVAETICHFIPIPTLTGRYKTALTCHPLDDGTTTYPLHIFAHGDFMGGSIAIRRYKPHLQELASFGFVVVAFASCPIDHVCHNGQSYIVEALKTIAYLEEHHPIDGVPIDLNLPYSASGHSTGGRTALMLAAARDSVEYLKSPAIDFINLTARDRRILHKIVAVVGDHPDPMYDSYFNPDVSHYNITQTPTMIITGTRDMFPVGEPVYSAWGNFVFMPRLTNRVFLNIEGATHNGPVLSHTETKYVAYFSQFHVLGNETAGAMIYGSDNAVEGSLLNMWKRGEVVASAGARNNGGVSGEVGFLACGGKSGDVPAQFGQYCDSGMIGVDGVDGVDVELQRILIVGEREGRVILLGCGILVAVLCLIWLGMRQRLRIYTAGYTQLV